jgi:hypothetical protein
MEYRMADHALAGHLRVGNLAHQFGFEPLRAAHIGSRCRLGQRAFVGFQLLQLLVQAFQRGLIEARADLACIEQLSTVVMQPK